MPTYDYECKKCDEIFEVFQKITDPKLDKCPKCGFKIKRLLGTGGGIIFKGSGFYQTDFKNKGAKPVENPKSVSSEKKESSNAKEKSSGNETISKKQNKKTEK